MSEDKLSDRNQQVHNSDHKIERDQIYDALFKQAPIGITISMSEKPGQYENNDLFGANPVYIKITGRTSEELATLGWAKITHPDDIEQEMVLYNRLQAGEIDSYSYEKRMLRPDGTYVWVSIVVAPFELADHKERRYICLVQDISKRREIEKALVESERSKSVLLSHLPGLAYRCDYDQDWTMKYVSEGCYELTGYKAASLLNNREMSFNDIIMPEYRHLLRSEWEKVLADRSPFRYEYEIVTADGDRKWVLELGEGIFNCDGEVEALEGIILDISDRKTMEIDLRYVSEHDVLTGLNNRRYLEILLREELSRPVQQPSALVGINLSAIHLLNLSYGFQYTQNLIRKVVRFLRPHCDSQHLLFSTYENQLAFYIRSYKSRSELNEFSSRIAQILSSLLAVERVGAGIGVVEINDSYINDVELLLKRLQIVSEFDMDLRDVDYKIQFYDTAMEEKILREDEIKRALAKIAEGIDQEQFYMQFQPLLDLETDSICGFEALARMKNESLGQISPVEFIPIAEETKLIVPLGEIIFKQAFAFMQELQKRDRCDIKVSVNVSAIQLLKRGFVDNLLHLINEMEIDPTAVGIEITESVFSSNYQEINRILGELKQYGIVVALDDFGTGYSSLARERELNINCLKIDKYFIDNLLEVEEQDAITGDIISLAHKLGHCVIAEGIEQSTQLAYLEKNNCDLIQGYLIGRPMDQSVALDFLDGWQGRESL